MRRNMKHQLAKEIETFNKTGKLPREWDVKQGLGYSDWLKKKQSVEPVANTGNIMIAGSFGRTQYAAKFAEWKEKMFSTLPVDERELFTMYYERNISQAHLAVYFGVSRQTIIARLQKQKREIANYIGLKTV